MNNTVIHFRVEKKKSQLQRITEAYVEKDGRFCRLLPSPIIPHKEWVVYGF